VKKDIKVKIIENSILGSKLIKEVNIQAIKRIKSKLILQWLLKIKHKNYKQNLAV
jgi:hypothetical protein